MTRFWISLQQGVELVIKALKEAKGGEAFISKIPSFKIIDLAQAMLPGCQMPEVGIREGEKYFVIYPQMVWNEKKRVTPAGKRVEEGFSYSSDNNTEWLGIEEIKELLGNVELEKPER